MRTLAVKIARTVLVVTLVAAVAGCEPSQADCPFPASDCPTSCMRVDAMQVDEARGCRFETLLGCMPPGEQTTDAACFRNVDDGRIVTASGSAMTGRPGWRRCGAAEFDRVKAAAPVCAPPGDASTQ